MGKYPIKPLAKLYNTKRWQQIRQHQLTQHPLCAWHLKKTPPQMVRATVVHHVHPHKGNEIIFYNGPFESLCSHCHDSKAQQDEKWGYSLDIGTDGWPVDPKHPANRV
jgi:5-methylcytosine-specific restriction enzyme A